MTIPARAAADDSLSDRIAATTQRLAAEFSGQVAPETVEDVAQRSLKTYEHAAVLDFIPLFVERYTRESLKASIGHLRA